MRMSTGESRDEQLALDSIATAAEAGVTVFDTAHAYGRDEHELGHNERLLATALRRCGADGRARVVTKGGMSRAGGGWVPDGRARSILEGCEASLAALEGLPIDLYLIHAPDPRTPWRTSVRALARLADHDMVRRVGVSNVNRAQLDEALELAPIAAVQVGLSVFDDRAVRGGVVERCVEAGVMVMAHSPLGGPRRAKGLGRQAALVDAAEGLGATPAEVALAWLLELSPALVAIPGARRPDTARSAAAAATLRLDRRARGVLAGAFGGPRPARVKRPARADDAEVVLVMGIPGAGKSRVAEDYVARGYLRLNRDERGGSLRELADALEEELASGVRRVVLDNTYLTRAVRSYVIDAAGRQGIPTRCIWLDTPLAQAQANHVERLLDQFGSLRPPACSRRRPRCAPIASSSHPRRTRVGTAWSSCPSSGLASLPWPEPQCLSRPPRWSSGAGKRHWTRATESAPHLVFDWRPGETVDALAPAVASLAAEVSGRVEGALCPHAAGPPSCWCRPPLPGLPLAFAHARNVDPSASIVIGVRPAHRTLAATLGARYVDV